MPTKPGPLQIKIINAIGLAGHLSNSKLTDRMNISHPVVSDAITSLLQRRLIEFSYVDEERTTKTHKSGGRPEKYYALTRNGLGLFIDENPAPEEFFTAILNFYTIREQSFLLRRNTTIPVRIEEFENYFKRFKNECLSYASTQGYLIQSPFFGKLYRQWIVDNKPYFFEEEHLKYITTTIHSPFLENCLDQLFGKNSTNRIPITQKVLECLAIHRSLTEEQICKHISSKQKRIENKLGRSKYPDFVQNSAVTKENIAISINLYTLNKNYLQSGFQTSVDYDYNKIMKSYVEYLSHLIIVKHESPMGSRYELSLFGILLILSIITDRRQKMFYTIGNKFEKTEEDLISFYDKISQAYPEKLPLIFGKWALLSRINHNAYRWFLPVINQIIGDATQYSSVPITLGGIKEYQDCLHGITFYTITQLFKIYEGLSSALSNNNQNNDLDIPLINKDTNSEILLTLQEKEKELTAFLKYADLGRFVKHLEQINQLSDSGYNSELSIIENVLANEITISFYINLVRSKHLDYTDEYKHFLGDERDPDYRDTDEYHVLRPADFLRTILRSDTEIKEMFLGLINDIMKYHQQTGGGMNNFYENIKNWKRRLNK
jgi:DNA-binding MarR family transcriptional regulator